MFFVFGRHGLCTAPSPGVQTFMMASETVAYEASRNFFDFSTDKLTSYVRKSGHVCGAFDFEVLYRLHYGVLYNYPALVAVSVFAKVDRDLV